MGIGFGHDVDALLTRLGQPTSDIAKFCFEGAIDLIRDTPAHKLLMALSLFATDASREALGVVADLPVLDRDKGLEKLEKLSLVNKKGGRFALLPLTSAYCEAELGKQKALEPLFRERWLDFLSSFITKHSPKRYESIALVEPEIENIMTAIDWCRAANKMDHVMMLAQEMDFYYSLFLVHVAKIFSLRDDPWATMLKALIRRYITGIQRQPREVFASASAFRRRNCCLRSSTRNNRAINLEWVFLYFSGSKPAA